MRDRLGRALETPARRRPREGSARGEFCRRRGRCRLLPWRFGFGRKSIRNVANQGVTVSVIEQRVRGRDVFARDNPTTGRFARGLVLRDVISIGVMQPSIPHSQNTITGRSPPGFGANSWVRAKIRSLTSRRRVRWRHSGPSAVIIDRLPVQSVVAARRSIRSRSGASGLQQAGWRALGNVQSTPSSSRFPRTENR
jgi:hypothetical protein